MLRPGGKLVICDAVPFNGALSPLNPIVRAIFVGITAWHPEHNLAAAMNHTFGNVTVERFNAGSMMFATSVKEGAP